MIRPWKSISSNHCWIEKPVAGNPGDLQDLFGDGAVEGFDVAVALDGAFGDGEQLRVIGEMGVFTEQSRSTRVVAEEGCVVMMLGNDVWAEIFASDPDIGIKMQSGLIKDLYARIHDMNQELRALRRQDRGE
jgi:hypothetical protein